MLRLSPGQGRRLRAGAPWVFSNEIAMQPEYRQCRRGGLVRLEGDDGGAPRHFHVQPALADRRAAAGPRSGRRDRRGLAAGAAGGGDRRCGSGCATAPFHRLVHAEADRLPGLMIDRYDDVAVLAGEHRRHGAADAADRRGAARAAAAARGRRAAMTRPRASWRACRRASPCCTAATRRAEVVEGGVRFPVDLLAGQKTGWFFDQRPNRDRVAALAGGARVLDVFCHTGAFGLRCAAAGAAAVTLVDASAPALEQAQQAAALKALAERVATHARRCVRDDDGARRRRGKIRHRGVRSAGVRPLAQGRRGRAARLWPHGATGGAAGRAGRVPVRRVVQLPRAAGGVGRRRSPSGCIARGARAASWSTSGAGPDHPVHPHLPETAYLKAQLLQLD